MCVYMCVCVFRCIIYSMWGTVLWGQRPQEMRTGLNQIPFSESNEIQDVDNQFPSDV